MSHYPSTPADLARSLRALAARLDTLGDVDLAPAAIALSVGFQLHTHYGTQSERIAAVDAVAEAVGLQRRSTSSDLYRTERSREHGLGSIDINVFTGVQSERELALERENEELRARLAANGNQA